MSRRPQSNREVGSGCAQAKYPDFATSVVDDSRLSAAALVVETNEPAILDNERRLASGARIKKIGGRCIPRCNRRLASRAAVVEIYEARIETVICINYLAKNELRRASRARVMEIDREDYPPYSLMTLNVAAFARPMTLTPWPLMFVDPRTLKK